jgi:Glycosyltransferase like family 2
MTRQLAALGVVVPARQDGAYAASTVRALLASADALAAAGVTVPVTVVLVDDGGNDDFGSQTGGLPDDARLAVATTTEHGPGHARTAGAQAFADRLAGTAPGVVRPGEPWIVSLDVDVVIGADFLARWVAAIETSSADVLGAPAHFGPIGTETSLAPDVEAASTWMWGDTGLYAHFAGLVNVGGCNHAVPLAVCRANSWYLQPTQVVDGAERIVAGDDWDFGLRARLSGFTTTRVPGPVVTTSTRRIAADPVGFLAGRSYERPFEPIRGDADPTAWPPAESWAAVAGHGRARLVAHFLAKPLLAGLPSLGALGWFLGPELDAELDKLLVDTPAWRPGQEWNSYRTELVERCFSDEVFGWCSRVALRIAGVQ